MTGAPAIRTALGEAAVRARLASVRDPEIPTVSIVDLGLVDRIDLSDGTIHVELLPTFVGCPALDAIKAAVESALAGLDRPVDVRFTYRVPWTSERISGEGRRRLAETGFAPPVEPANLRCPRCESGDVVLDSLFGPTQCRSLAYCRACRQPFEAFKPV